MHVRVAVGGRIVHSYGVSGSPENYGYRVAGMALTFTALGGAAASLLRNAMSAEAHLLQEGGHAFASGYAGSLTASWIGTFDAWLGRLRANRR